MPSRISARNIVGGEPSEAPTPRTITTKDVFRHGRTILRIWGIGCYLACLRAAFADRPTSFLEVLSRRGAVLRGGRA